MNSFRNLFIIITLFIIPREIVAQSFYGNGANREFTRLIELPTAGTLINGDQLTSFKILPHGIIILQFELGLWDFMNLGVSYGGSNIIGTGEPSWNPNLNFDLKLRISKETQSSPSFTLGLNNQLKGMFIETKEQHGSGSTGVYFVVSKNYKLLGFFSLHSIISYAFDSNNDNRFKIGIGAEKTIMPWGAVIVEYSPTINENSIFSLFENWGYLNVGLKFSLGKGVSLGIIAKDLLESDKIGFQSGFGRGIVLEYNSSIF